MTGTRHVCVVSTSSSFGGAESYLGRVVAGLASDYEFSALVPRDADPQTVSLLNESGAAVEGVRGLRRLPSTRGLWSMIEALGRIRPSLLHLNLTDQRDGVSPLIAARVRGVPVVATLNLVLPSGPGIREACSRLALGGSDAVIAVSNAVGEYLRGCGVDPRVVRQGLAKPMLAADARQSLGLAAGDIVVGGVGRLHAQKGWDILCEAARVIRRTRSDIRFVVVGDGPEEQALREAAACGHVEFVGSRKEANTLMGAFDVLVVPSRYEAFGLVALEAMLSGVPVIASQAGGLPEVVDGAGRLVPCESPDALADAILELLADEGLRSEVVSRGLERAESEFGLQRMIDETRAVYEEVGA